MSVQAFNHYQIEIGWIIYFFKVKKKLLLFFFLTPRQEYNILSPNCFRETIGKGKGTDQIKQEIKVCNRQQLIYLYFEGQQRMGPVFLLLYVPLVTFLCSVIVYFSCVQSFPVRNHIGIFQKWIYLIGSSILFDWFINSVRPESLFDSGPWILLLLVSNTIMEYFQHKDKGHN